MPALWWGLWAWGGRQRTALVTATWVLVNTSYGLAVGYYCSLVLVLVLDLAVGRQCCYYCSLVLVLLLDLLVLVHVTETQTELSFRDSDSVIFPLPLHFLGGFAPQNRPNGGIRPRKFNLQVLLMYCFINT